MNTKFKIVLAVVAGAAFGAAAVQSRAKGSRRKLGYLVTGRQCRVRGMVRIGKVRSRSR